jgi:hypothetical protein
MKLFACVSPDGDGLPQPADRRRLALGFDAWEKMLAGTGAGSEA